MTSNDFYEWYSVGSAGKREEETAEEALFYSQNIAPLLERMTAASSSECYFSYVHMYISLYFKNSMHVS